MRLLCFFGHHRSASSWTNDVLRQVCRKAGWDHRTVHNEAMVAGDLAGFCARVRPDLLTLSNARAGHLAALPPFRGLHLIRDPRDILVSSYFSHRNSHPTDRWPELVAHRAELRSLPQDEGLLLELGCRREQFEQMAAWTYDVPHILELKMEELTRAPLSGFLQIFNFWQRLGSDADSRSERGRETWNVCAHRLEERWRLGFQLPRRKLQAVAPRVLEQVLSTTSFADKSGGRAPGQADEHHHYRKGVVGDWRHYFHPELKRRFKDSFDGLVVQLGYEEGRAW